MVKTYYKCLECGEINMYIGLDDRQGCDCDPVHLLPIKNKKGAL